jgi:hypothetical protein
VNSIWNADKSLGIMKWHVKAVVSMNPEGILGYIRVYDSVEYLITKSIIVKLHNQFTLSQCVNAMPSMKS